MINARGPLALKSLPRRQTRDRLCSLYFRLRPGRASAAARDTGRSAIAPSREAVVVCVACLFTWYLLADLGAREGLPCVLGHALSMPAIYGGNATHDTSDAQHMAVRLRGGMLPQA